MWSSIKKSKQGKYKKDLFLMDKFNSKTKSMYQLCICSLAEGYRAQDRYDRLTKRRQKALQVKESMDSLIDHFQGLYYKQSNKLTMRALIIKAYESSEITETGKRKLREVYPFLREIFHNDVDDEIVDDETCSNYNEDEFEDSYDYFNEDTEYEATCDEYDNVDKRFYNTKCNISSINKSPNSEISSGNWHSVNDNNHEIEDESEDEHF